MLRNKKYICVLLSLFVCSGSMIFGASNVCADSVVSRSVERKKFNDSNDDIHVSDVFELLQAIDRVPKWGKIVLEDDIDTLSLKIALNHSMVLDLNGHTITVENESEGIIVENKITVNQKKIVKQYPSSYVWDSKSHRVRQPFFGGNGYRLDVVEYETTEQYDDDICVTIRNGKILHKAAKNCEDGVPNTWFECMGGCGETPAAPLVLSSGNVYLDDLEIIGGDGGNGGNGAYYSGEHLPVTGDCGADGGNGGNGGSAIYVLRKEVKLMMNDGCKICSGKAGVAGKGGEASKNYWFYRSKNGADGKDGIVNQEIFYKYKK